MHVVQNAELLPATLARRRPYCRRLTRPASLACAPKAPSHEFRSLSFGGFDIDDFLINEETTLEDYFGEAQIRPLHARAATDGCLQLQSASSSSAKGSPSDILA